MHITNYKKIAKTPLRKKALEIVEAGYGAIEIEKTIKNKISLNGSILKIDYFEKQNSSLILDLDDFKDIYLIGIGKGSALASTSLANILKNRLKKGFVIDIEIPKNKKINSNLEIVAGTHPLPSKRNVLATKKIMKLAQKADKDDLVITFICGGGSALACATLDEMNFSTTVFKSLTFAGADIVELNTVRKHISEIKGGNLAKLIYPATGISLIVSDVLGNDLSMIASGLTVKDKTIKKDAENILKKYKVFSKFSILNSRFLLRETPKDDKYFENIKNILFVSNETAILAMAQKAKDLKIKPKIESLFIKGEASKTLAALMSKVKKEEVLLLAGETTVTFTKETQKNNLIKPGSKSDLITGSGKGGRNQEAVLGALSKIKDFEVVVVSFASDGHDNTPAAGAIACKRTIMEAQKKKLNPDDYLFAHNSFHFFEKTGDLIYVKKNAFNVSDLMFIIKNN